MDLVKRASKVLDDLYAREAELDVKIQALVAEKDELRATRERLDRQIEGYSASKEMTRQTQEVIEVATDVLVQLEEAVLKGGEEPVLEKEPPPLEPAPKPRLARPVFRRELRMKTSASGRKKPTASPKSEAKPTEEEEKKKLASVSPRAGRILRSSFAGPEKPPTNLRVALERTYTKEGWRKEKVQVLGYGGIKSEPLTEDLESKNPSVNPKAVVALAPQFAQAIGVLEQVRTKALSKEDLNPRSRGLYDQLDYETNYQSIRDTLETWGVLQK